LLLWRIGSGFSLGVQVLRVSDKSQDIIGAKVQSSKSRHIILITRVSDSYWKFSRSIRPLQVVPTAAFSCLQREHNARCAASIRVRQ
jgi:hypothetical protein